MTLKNVLLIIADDWSPIAGCFGDPVVKTPNIDALHARSLSFSRAYCTSPSCAASRANILTGLYSHAHRQYGHCHGEHNFKTREDIPTLPSLLRECGWQSGLAGKAHIAPESAYPFSQWRPAETAGELFCNETLATLTRDCLEGFDDRPFYLHVASGYPHRVGGTFDPAMHAEQFLETDVQYDPALVPVPDFLPDLPEVRRDIADYYRFISRFDAFVGRTLKELEASGKAEETLVILTSDHGMPFPGAKCSPFEAGHHCPLLIADPRESRGGRSCDALVNWCDLLPTILDAMGASPDLLPDNLTGRSLMPLLEDPGQIWETCTTLSHSFHEVTNYYPYRAVCGERYKYLRCLAHPLPVPMGMDLYDSPTWQSMRESDDPQVCAKRDHLLHREPEAFYDLQEDPAEANNLIADPSLHDMINHYREKLTQLRKRTEDPWLEVDFQEGFLQECR